MESAGFHRGGRRKPVIPRMNIASWTQGVVEKEKLVLIGLSLQGADRGNA